MGTMGVLAGNSGLGGRPPTSLGLKELKNPEWWGPLRSLSEEGGIVLFDTQKHWLEARSARPSQTFICPFRTTIIQTPEKQTTTRPTDSSPTSSAPSKRHTQKRNPPKPSLCDYSATNEVPPYSPPTLLTSAMEHSSLYVDHLNTPKQQVPEIQRSPPYKTWRSAKETSVWQTKRPSHPPTPSP